MHLFGWFRLMWCKIGTTETVEVQKLYSHSCMKHSTSSAFDSDKPGRRSSIYSTGRNPELLPVQIGFQVNQ